MNTLTWQDYLQALQDRICQFLPPEQTIEILPPELQDIEVDALKDTQAYEDYLFTLSIMFL